MSRVLKIVIGLCIVIACAAAGLYGTGTLLSGEESGTGQEGSAQQATRVGVTSPEMRSIEDAVSAVGTLMPVRSVALVPNAPGRVTEVPVSSGEEVAEGDLLIQLDDRAERAALSEAEATLSEAQQEFTASRNWRRQQRRRGGAAGRGPRRFLAGRGAADDGPCAAGGSRSSRLLPERSG